MVSGILAQRRIQLVLLALFVSLAIIFLKDLNPFTLDLNLGIEFVGGVRIPVSLEKSVDAATMSTIVDTIKLRINKFGLGQSIVRPLGDKEVLVEIPRADPSAIKSVERILREQGRFEAIIDGRVALTGADVLSGAVGGAQGERITEQDGSIKWELDFAVTREGADRFAKTALGKDNFPVYLFLDRPENAAIVLSKSKLGATTAEETIREALKKEGNNLVLVYEEDWAVEANKLLNSNKSIVILAEEALGNKEIARDLQQAGFSREENASKKIVVKPSKELNPTVIQATGVATISEWRAIGLLSAPVLSSGLASGIASQFYSVTGTAQGASQEERKANAIREIKELKSVISGGRLPVSTTIGSSFTVAPSLGEQFLSYSFITIFIAVIVVAIMITIRYRKPFLVIPIVFTNIVEIIMLIALIGGLLGTLDLGAMAGVIALIGTGVDNQIIITDEILRRETSEAQAGARTRLGRAFYIIFTTAGIAVASMLPLMLSGIVEVTGFALATILGVIIGVGVTRPAYGALVETMSVQQ